MIIITMKIRILLALSIGAYLSLSPLFAQNKNKPNPLAIPEVAAKDIICFALYTVHDQTLKLTAQLYPIPKGAPRSVSLEVKEDGEWQEIAQTTVIERGWTAPFRVEDWDDSKTQQYRVTHGSEAFYQGIIRKNPTDKDEILVAGFTGNSITPSHGGDISRQDIIDNIKAVDTDILFFSGDQVYNHHKHYACLLYTSPSPRDQRGSRMPSSA